MVIMFHFKLRFVDISQLICERNSLIWKKKISNVDVILIDLKKY